jgi:hypothetical protein
MRRILFFVCLLFGGTLWCQQDTTANAAKQDPADEIGKFKKNCLFKHVIGCAEVLFTGQPLHIAVGTIAPQNGFASGLAYVGHKDTENWSNSWNADAVASANGSWRAGLYVKFVDTRLVDPIPQMGTHGIEASELPVYTEQPVFNLYLQAISLNKLTFFGEGPGTTVTGRSFYGMTETILGGSTVRPIYARLNMGLYGEINGRSIDIRPSPNQPSPSIEQIYTPASAPELATQPFFLQLGAGVRMRPTAFNDHLHFNYDLAYRPFIAVSDGDFSFQRLTIDLYQEYSLRGKHALRLPWESNGPDDCRVDATDPHAQCPKPTSNAMDGTIGIRALTSLSMTPGGNAVPFYFQPTLGGADINGNPSLPSYQDYRFRAPNILLLRESFEHSIGKWPLGIILLADQAKLGLTRGDLGTSHWVHSYAAGLTLRAGGFPQVYLLFAFGGNEGTHTIANVNTSLLGTSGRPSLF